MLYIAVCDDDPLEVQRITTYLKALSAFGLQAETTPFSSGIDLIEAHKNGRHFHLIILDMLMKPVNGMAAAKVIRQFDPLVPVLIVTATSEYAIKGYEINACRYLLKPIKKAELLNFIVPLLKDACNRSARCFTFSTESAAVRVPIDDILYFESDLRRLRLVAKNGQYVFRGKISAVEAELAPYPFIRIHKSFVVNLSRVQAVEHQTLFLDNGESLPVSKHRYKAILKRFMEISVLSGH